jgi:hypothetical protein
MSDAMEVAATETGLVRVFHIDLPREAIERFTVQAGTGEFPLKYALGATELRRDLVDVVLLRDLGAMSLSRYLAEAYDVAGPELEAMRARLDALKGHVLVLPSEAFDRVPQKLTISVPLRWIGTFTERKAAKPGPTPRSRGAEGTLAPSGDGSAPRGRGTITALFIAALLLLTLGFALAGRP